MDRAKYLALKRELEALIPKEENLTNDISQYTDNFYLSFLYSQNIHSAEEAMQFCLNNGIYTLSDMLNYVARTVFNVTE